MHLEMRQTPARSRDFDRAQRSLRHPRGDRHLGLARSHTTFCTAPLKSALADFATLTPPRVAATTRWRSRTFASAIVKQRNHGYAPRRRAGQGYGRLTMLKCRATQPSSKQRRKITERAGKGFGTQFSLLGRTLSKAAAAYSSSFSHNDAAAEFAVQAP